MIIEGRTIKTIAELQEFCAAAVAGTHADPATIRLHVPHDMRIDEITLADGSKAYDVLVSSARLNRLLRAHGLEKRPP